jgi:major type 1 subunit fimbrin (pilin)
VNTLIKRAMLVAGISTAMALPLSSQASDGTITFTGAVTANTCTVNVNGSGSNNATVTLPTVGTASLDNTATKTTGAGTFFNIAITSCAALVHDNVVPTTVGIYFEAGPNVDQATGGLINTVVGGSNVEVNLYNASNATIIGTQVQPGVQGQGAPTLTPPQGYQPGTLTPAPTLNETQWFYAGYSTVGHNAAATPGLVSTSVTYSLVYQ